MRKLKLLMLIGVLFSFQLLWAQTQVTGRVTEKNGAPIADATVRVKNSGASTITDANGSFTINAPQNATLVISHINFGTSEVTVTSNNISSTK